jgi:amidophosphoribosyltransferase
MLMAHNRSFEEIREILGVDSLDYLTLEDLPETVEGLKCGFCNACFTGDYAVKVSDGLNKDILGGCADE